MQWQHDLLRSCVALPGDQRAGMREIPHHRARPGIARRAQQHPVGPHAIRACGAGVGDRPANRNRRAFWCRRGHHHAADHQIGWRRQCDVDDSRHARTVIGMRELERRATAIACRSGRAVIIGRGGAGGDHNEVERPLNPLRQRDRGRAGVAAAGGKEAEVVETAEQLAVRAILRLAEIQRV